MRPIQTCKMLDGNAAEFVLMVLFSISLQDRMRVLKASCTFSDKIKPISSVIVVES